MKMAREILNESGIRGLSDVINRSLHDSRYYLMSAQYNAPDHLTGDQFKFASEMIFSLISLIETNTRRCEETLSRQQEIRENANAQ